MELQFDTKTCLSLVVLCFIGLLHFLYNALVAKPRRLRSFLSKQGISGPPPSLLLGNAREMKMGQSTAVKAHTSEPPVSHNCAAYLFGFFDKWRKQYGISFIHIMSSLSSSSPSFIFAFLFWIFYVNNNDSNYNIKNMLIFFLTMLSLSSLYHSCHTPTHYCHAWYCLLHCLSCLNLLLACMILFALITQTSRLKNVSY